MRLSGRDRVLLLGPLGVLLSAFLVIPSVLGFLATFTSYAPGLSAIRFTALDNYAAVVRDPEFLAAIRNIGLLTVVAVPAELAIGFGLASLMRQPFRGRALCRVLLLMPWLVSPIANGVMWHYLLGSGTGLLAFGLSWLGVAGQPSPLGDVTLALPTTVAVEVWRTAPLAGFLLLPSLSAIPSERWEDATLDGASWLDQIVHVAAPAMRPLVLAVTLLLVGASLGTFDGVLIMTGGGPGTATTTPALLSYQRAFQANDWPVGAAASWFIVLAVLLVGIAYVRVARGQES